MNQVRVEDGLAIADRAVAMALEAGAEQAEALVMHTRSALTRFANNEIHQNVAEDDTVVNLRVIDGYRVGVASANRLTDEDLGRLAASATATARLLAPQDYCTSPIPFRTSVVRAVSVAISLPKSSPAR
jgi:predicted Zn-dependent protease